MDAFFASVEIRDNPELRGKPVLVGGVGRRGVVAAASYPARAFGCRSAQPMAVALRLCPNAIVLPGRHEAYAEASDRAFEVFAEFSPTVEGLSIDEAFLDMTGTERLLGSPRSAAEALRAEVARKTGGLTCSVGISAVKFIAKIASSRLKPDGVTEVLPGRELAFLDPLDISELWGVGPKTAERLRAHGIATIADVRRLSGKTLEEWFGQHGQHLFELANARDPRVVMPWRQRKQVSHEDTFADDVAGVPALRRKLLSQATRVADRLVAKGWLARQIQIKIRDIAFRTETRQATLEPATDDARTFYRAACELLASVDTEHRRFRLTGLAAGDLRARGAESEQLDLVFEPSPDTRAPLDPRPLQSVLSAVRERFGHRALFPAEAGSDERVGSAGGHTDARPERPDDR